jgi:ABC-type Fe3+/spermidine/putrescine transport system ATPase subunit
MLSLRNLYKSYVDPGDPAVWLVHALSLEVEDGQTVALLGRSGCGKSTLLKMVAGLETLDAGSIEWDGQDISNLLPEQRRFAMMFQDFALFTHLNVLDNVTFGLIEQKIPKSVARAKAHEMLERFGMAGHAMAKVTRLSGGEQQRVALARALVTKPRLLLLDEPFSALDADLKATLRHEFMTHIAQSKVAALLVTHDEAEARAMAQTGYRLFNGGLTQIW